jgi:hypothetical protein
VVKVGVPEEEVAAKTADLNAIYDEVRQKLNRGVNSIGGVQSLKADWTWCETTSNLRLQEWRELYNPDRGGIRLGWPTLAGNTVTLKSNEDVETLLDRLRRRLQEALAQNGSVTIE